MDQMDAFEAERPRLLRIATHVLRDAFEAQDVVQQTWSWPWPCSCDG